jgi:hypothetical protein
MKSRPVVLAIAASVAACKRPDPAPAEFDALCAYLYDHADDDDDTAATDGVENMMTWLDDGYGQMTDGYEVESLYQSTLDEIGDDRDASAIAGAAIASSAGDLQLPPVVDSLILADQLDVYSETYDSYDREFDGDEDCFAAGDCDWLEMDNDSVATLPIIGAIEVKMHAQERWIETSRGAVLLHRGWLAEPSNNALMDLPAEYHLSVTYPGSDGGVIRAQALWADVKLIGIPVPEGSMLKTLVKNLVNADAALYEYTRDHE